MSLKSNYESQSCCKEQQKDVGWHFLKKLTTLQNLRDVFKQHSIQEIYQLYIKLEGQVLIPTIHLSETKHLRETLKIYKSALGGEYCCECWWSLKMGLNQKFSHINGHYWPPCHCWEIQPIRVMALKMKKKTWKYENVNM